MSGCSGGTIGTQQGCQINMTFVPTQVGPRSATVTITDNSPTSPQIVTATGIGSELSFSSFLLFTTWQKIGSPSSKPITLTNQGTTNSISINSISEVGGDYLITSSTCQSSLAPGASCVLNVQFTPSAAGPRWGLITITDSDPGSPHQIRMAGNGIYPTANAVTVTEEEMQKYKDDEGEDD